MKILIGQVHPGYTVNLCATGHEFFVRRGLNPFAGDQWADRIRPQPPNLHVVPDWTGRYDLAIVPIAGAPPDDVPPVDCPRVYLHLWDAAPALGASARKSAAWVFLSREVAFRTGAEADPRTVVIEPGVDPVFDGWVGGGGQGVAIGHHLRWRGDKGYATLRAVLDQVPLVVFGYANDELPRRCFVDNFGTFLRILRTAPVFFNPSPWVPQSGIEMMALGAPTVQMLPHQYRDFFRDGINCRTPAYYTPAIDALRELLADPPGAAALGGQARRDAFPRFGLATFVAKWNALFQRVTS